MQVFTSERNRLLLNYKLDIIHIISKPEMEVGQRNYHAIIGAAKNR